MPPRTTVEMCAPARQSRPSLAGRDASIDVQHLAGDELGGGGNEERDWTKNVSWLGDSPEWDARLECGAELGVVQILARHVSIDEGRRHAVDGDAVRRQLNRVLANQP